MTDFRIPFIDTLMALAERDKRIILIVPDVGFKHADRFQEKYPDRYFNFGVTEATTVIAAANMALKGLKPWVYTMCPFVLYGRPAEAVRNAVVCHNANVKLVGVTGAGNYGFLGFSHNPLHKNEDRNFARNIGLRALFPRSSRAVSNVVLKENKVKSAAYIRL